MKALKIDRKYKSWGSVRGKHEKHKKRVSALFLLPSILGVLVFFILPFIVVIVYSMVDNPINMEFTGFSNFLRVINNGAFKKAVFNTMRFSAIAVPLAVVLSLLLAVVLEWKIPFKSQFRTFFLSPMMVPVASVVLIWQVLFHYNGALNEWLAPFGVEKIDWLKSQYSHVVIVVLFLWKNLGYNMILFMAALSNIPGELVEVARLENANKWQIFWHIKLRFMSSTVLFVTIMSLINSFKVFREVYLMTGGYPYDSLYLLQHYMNNMFEKLNYQNLSAAAVLMSLVMIVIIGIMFTIENYYGRDVEG